MDEGSASTYYVFIESALAFHEAYGCGTIQDCICQIVCLTRFIKHVSPLVHHGEE